MSADIPPASWIHERERARKVAVTLEQKLARVEALHGVLHWCFNEDAQSEVYEPGTEWWPCPTLATLLDTDASQ